MKKNKKEQNKIKLSGVFYISALFIGILVVFFLCGTLSQASGSDAEYNYKYYTNITIESGDTLWSIASEHMCNEYDSVEAFISEIKTINNITDDSLILAGGNLIIPYYTTEFKLCEEL